MHISKIKLDSFKRISSAEMTLKNINVLIGGNNSGKSSILQGIHFSITAAIAARQQGQKTFSADYLLFNPAHDFSLLRNGTPYKNFQGEDNRSTLRITKTVPKEDGTTEDIVQNIEISKASVGCASLPCARGKVLDSPLS